MTASEILETGLAIGVDADWLQVYFDRTRKTLDRYGYMATPDGIVVPKAGVAAQSMFVVFDLDGTLALNEHRQHYVQREVGKKDWRAFFAECDKDGLFWQVARMLQVLDATGNRVEIWSGRSSEVIEKTKAWLAEHGLAHVPFRCRDEGDHTPDHDLKKSWSMRRYKSLIWFSMIAHRSCRCGAQMASPALKS